jgi:4-amino-4-deoxy-L-arabinose transferase-like glycosyltransferase
MTERTKTAWPIAAAAFLIAGMMALQLLEISRGNLTNTDELLTAERSREMLLLGRSSVHLNFEPSFAKPPLQYWLTTLTLGKIDHREVAVRIWPLIFGGLTACALGWLAFLLDPSRPWLIFASVAFLVSCPPFLAETSRALLDSGLMFFVTLTIIFAHLARKQPVWWLAVAAACWLGALQKIPLTYLIWLLILLTRLSSARERATLRSAWLVVAIFLAILAGATWPLIQLAKYHCSIADAFGVREAPVLLGPTRLGQRPYLEIPMRMTMVWLGAGVFALLAPVVVLFSKKGRAQAAVAELSVVSLGVIVLAVLSNFRSVRYILPVIPSLCLLLAVVLLWLIEQRPAFKITAIAAALLFSVIDLVQGQVQIALRRNSVPGQLLIAEELGARQEAGIPIFVIRPQTGREVLYQLFYLFYGNLRFPVTKLSPEEFRETSPPVPAMGICVARDLPLLREKFGDVIIQRQCDETIVWIVGNRPLPQGRLRNRDSFAAGMTLNNTAIFHFVDPIARVGDESIVRDKQERFVALTDQIVQ